MSPSLLKSNFEPFSLLQQEVSPCIVEVVPTPCSLNLNPPTSKLASNKPLLVCDFDCSLIEVDSDEFVLGFYGGISLVENLRNAYKSGTGSWLQSVAHAMSQLFSNRKIPSLDALKKRLAQIPMDPSTLKMLRDLSQSGVDIIIISDANTFFIETILEAYDIRDCIKTILSNVVGRMKTPSDRDFLEFYPAMAEPHGCSSCPANLCKTVYLKKFLNASQKTYSSILYVGDGMNDLCPLESGVVKSGFIRKNHTLHKHFINRGINSCQIQIWENGHELNQLVTSQCAEK